MKIQRMKLLFLSLFVILILHSNTHAQFVTTRINTPYGTVSTTTFHYMPMYFNYGSGDPFKNTMYLIVLKNQDTIRCKGTMVTENKQTYIKLKKPLKDSLIYPKNTISIRNIIKKDTSIAYPYKDSIWLIEPNVDMKKKAIVMYVPMSVELNSIYLKQNGVLTLATNDMVLRLVAGDPKAEKKAKKNQLADAIDVFNSNKDQKQYVDVDIDKIETTMKATDPDDKPLTF
ncbi:hypothetical protein [Rhizosphaericola mali]|uniref:GLPGLI family protein n=1 Tax=Rhizosphaericola mali TaxID=2545455 RepID=A0A5P2G7H0_9BACT|nr:hypothetical protein [Rhizosphaericola mali]QES89710.1 hypothetical protein E0W69_013915 [Rhizosphaericola mali]